MYTGGTAFLDALHEGGVSYIFANFGSDHPAILESLADARRIGKALPKVILCPNEMAALSAAHGYAQMTGRAQAVVVHVECGTQSLGGAVHNAARGRIPVLIFAGASPATQEGEGRGSRNEFIHWLQDVPDQRGIVRNYVKYEHEIRRPENLKQIVHRSLQFAHSEPKGPVYLMAAREVLEQEVQPCVLNAARWPAVCQGALMPADVEEIAMGLMAARRPLVVTSYVGRNPPAVEELVELCGRFGIGVLESVPNNLNFPPDEPAYQGCQGNEPRQNRALEEADFILVVDSDVPWIPLVNRPRPDAKVYHIDIDPLKERIPMWQLEAVRTFRANTRQALLQIREFLEACDMDVEAVEERRRHYTSRHEARERELAERETPAEGLITPVFLTASVRRFCDADTVVLNEGITNYTVITDHIGITRPGHRFASGGGSLGWNGGAAIGVKLACPEKTVVTLTGDGSYMFSQPSTVHWIARRYRTPFVQVIYNNGGWNAPRLSTMGVHPDGYASRGEDIGVSFDPAPDYGGIATAAGGALALRVDRAEELDSALAAAFRAVREEGRCAVVDVALPHL